MLHAHSLCCEPCCELCGRCLQPVDAHMTPETWRLHSVAWQLIHTLQRTLGGLTGAFWEARSGLAALHSAGSRRASGSGEQSPGVPSPREPPRPGSASHLLENGKPRAPSAALPGPQSTSFQGTTPDCRLGCLASRHQQRQFPHKRLRSVSVRLSQPRSCKLPTGASGREVMKA